MDVNVINTRFAEITNKKDGLFMTMSTKDNRHFAYVSFDLKTREHALFAGNVFRFITDDFYSGKPSMNTRYQMHSCKKNGFNLYNSKRTDESLRHHTEDMLKGFFVNKNYINSVMNRSGKLSNELSNLKAQNASANQAIAHRNVKIAEINKQLGLHY